MRVSSHFVLFATHVSDHHVETDVVAMTVT